MGETLLAPFTIAKMQDVVMLVDRQKCPREDGLSRALFTTYWELID